MSESHSQIRPPVSLEATVPSSREISSWVIDYCNQEAQQSGDDPDNPIALVDTYIAEFAAHPGKQIRGKLVGIGHEMFGGENQKAALHVAGIAELSQMYLLIEDDVMDRSDMRRGMETIHVRVADWLRARGATDDVEHMSNMVGVNAGLILSHKIQVLLNHTPTDDATRLRLSTIYNQSLIRTGEGQTLDLVQSTSGVADEDAILDMYGRKTSYYSIISPLQMGAALAGASQGDMEELETFGWHAGRAYQVRDDWLGMFGSPDITGKHQHNDLDEGKMTLIIYRMVTQSSQADQEYIRNIRANRNLTGPLPVELSASSNSRIEEILNKSKAEKYVEQRAFEEASLAQAVLDRHPEWSQRNVRQLRDLLQYMLRRQS